MNNAAQLTNEQMAAITMKKADQVDDNIFISGYLIAADPEYVKSNGITRIVKMFADDRTYVGGYHRHPGVKYFVAAADDVPGYDIRKNADEALQFIKEGLAKNERILVHCHAGISRSSTVVLMHMMINRGLPFDAALTRLQAIRPVVQPNTGFMRHLRATDARLRRLKRAGRAPRARTVATLAPTAAGTPIAAGDMSLLLRISRTESGHAGSGDGMTKAGPAKARPAASKAPPSPPRAAIPPWEADKL